MKSKLKPCKICGSKKITLWDCGYSTFNPGGGRCENGHESQGEAGCLATKEQLTAIWNSAQQLTPIEKLKEESKRLRKKLRVLSKTIVSKKNEQDIDSQEIQRILETPYWIKTIHPDTIYQRNHDDHDGKPKGGLVVMFDKMGDAYISIDNCPHLRFRTFGGGGLSLRTRTALMILAEAIRLDNEKGLSNDCPF